MTSGEVKRIILPPKDLLSNYEEVRSVLYASEFRWDLEDALVDPRTRSRLAGLNHAPRRT